MSEYVDANSGALYEQGHPYGPLTMIRHGDGGQPSQQRAQSWERLTASGRDLRPASKSG